MKPVDQLIELIEDIQAEIAMDQAKSEDPFEFEVGDMVYVAIHPSGSLFSAEKFKITDKVADSTGIKQYKYRTTFNPDKLYPVTLLKA